MQNRLEFVLDKTGHKYLVRIASFIDAKDLSRFYGSLSSKTSKLFHPHRFDTVSLQRILSKKQDLRLLLIDGKEKVIGYSFLSRLFIFNQIGYFGIGISDEYQGRGLGKGFVQKLLNIGKHQGFHKIILNVYESNMGAVGLYTNLGFRKFIPNILIKYLVTANEIIKYEGLLVLVRKILLIKRPMDGTNPSSVWMELRV